MHLHNPRLVAWEPLWEPWRFHVRGKLSPSDEPPFTEVKVHADEACNINISLSMCELVSGTTLTLIDDITGVAQPSEEAPQHPPPLSAPAPAASAW